MQNWVADMKLSGNASAKPVKLLLQQNRLCPFGNLLHAPSECVREDETSVRITITIRAVLFDQEISGECSVSRCL